MDEPKVEGRVPDEEAAALMVPPDDEGMPTPRALDQVAEDQELSRGDVAPDRD